MFGYLILLVIGLVLLVGASDRLVVSAVRLSQALGVSAVLIGALVVGLGTSAPELLVSTIAALNDEIDIAVANVVSSNVANVTMVLGAAAAAATIVAHLRILRREGVLMFVAVFGLAAVAWDGNVERWEGGALAFGFLVAIYLLLRWSIGDGDLETAEEEIEELAAEAKERPLWLEILFGLVALAVTLVSANLVLDGAVGLGEELGLSATFLGFILGVGTSLPELATSLAAVRREETDLIVGNVLGSNLFNSLAVAGTAALVGPGPLLDLSRPTLGFMVLAALAAGLFSSTGQRVVRWEGMVLLVGFVSYAAITF